MEKEIPINKFKGFKLNDKEMSEFKIESVEIDKKTAKARQILEKDLPRLSEKSSEIKIRLGVAN